MESIVLSVLGGLIGVIVGVVAAVMISRGPLVDRGALRGDRAFLRHLDGRRHLLRLLPGTRGFARASVDRIEVRVGGLIDAEKKPSRIAVAALSKNKLRTALAPARHDHRRGRRAHHVCPRHRRAAERFERGQVRRHHAACSCARATSPRAVRSRRSPPAWARPPPLRPPMPTRSRRSTASPMLSSVVRVRSWVEHGQDKQFTQILGV